MGAKVLVAHGDTQQLERVVRDLIAIGFRVVATPDGGDAFARFFEEEPDLVVCSESLPVLDGRSFGQMIRSQAPSVPVVLLVSEAPSSSEGDLLLLREPLDVDELCALVPHLLPEATQQAGEPESAPSGGRGELYDTLVSFQRQGNLLALLDTRGVERLARIAELQHRPADHLVIREGDTCDGFYLLVNGGVRVTLAERGDEQVARLGSGEFFGEMALLSNQPRSASVWTCEPTTLLYFERVAVLELINDYPELREVLGGVALQRAEENLWQALANDGDVQRHLSQLLEGIEEGAPTPAPGLSSEGVPPASHAGVGTAPATASPTTFVQRTWRDSLVVLRLYSIEHQFGSGLLVGAVAGVAAVIIVLIALFGGRLERDESLVREEDNDAVTAMAGDGRTPDQPRASDEPIVPGKPMASGKPTAPDMAPAQDGPRDKPRATEIAEPTGSEKRSAREQTIDIPEGLSRKRLRRWLIEAFAEERFAEALAVGLHMAERRQLDWESRFALAEAARLAERPEVALEHYQAFIARYPPANIYMDDAQFWAAKLLAGQRRFAEARKLFSAVANNPRSNLRQRAQKRLAELPK